MDEVILDHIPDGHRRAYHLILNDKVRQACIRNMISFSSLFSSSKSPLLAFVDVLIYFVFFIIFCHFQFSYHPFDSSPFLLFLYFFQFPGIGHESRLRSLRLWKMPMSVYGTWKRSNDAETPTKYPEVRLTQE